MFRIVNMHGLFWKIFISFWLTFILIVMVTAYLTRYVISMDREFPLSMEKIKESAVHAIQIYEKEKSLDASLKQNNNHNNLFKDYLLDDSLNELLGSIQSKNIMESISEFSASGKEFDLQPFPERLALLKYNTGETEYIYVRQFMRPPGFARFQGRWNSKFVKSPPATFPLLFIGISIVITGIASYFFTSYLVSPIQKIQLTTNQLSKGNLTARVSSAMSPRKDELGKLGHDFDLMADRLTALLTSQKRLLRDISHELRTPLARLQVALELARAKSNELALTEHDRIEVETKRLDHLIGQILELVRVEQRKSELTYEAFNIVELVKYIVEDADFEASKSDKNITLHSMESCVVHMNKELIRRAIENVIRNAVTHSPPHKSVEVHISEKQNKIKEKFINIKVKDYGPGVQEDSLNNIFEPFYKARNKNSEYQNGYGIGLAIAKSAIEMHGGVIYAVNGSDCGLVVNVEISI